MKPQKIGDYTVRKLVEVVEPLSPEFAFVEFDPSTLDSHADWLSPHFIEGASAALTLLFSFHTYVVQGNGKTLLIDTCVGNHKERAALPSWHMQNRPYLDNLRAMGVAPEDVDYVMCTHLHADHVGWNTRLINGRWGTDIPKCPIHIFENGLRPSQQRICRRRQTGPTKIQTQAREIFTQAWPTAFRQLLKRG